MVRYRRRHPAAACGTLTISRKRDAAQREAADAKKAGRMTQ
jgi:hypothetical protein